MSVANDSWNVAAMMTAGHERKGVPRYRQCATAAAQVNSSALEVEGEVGKWLRMASNDLCAEEQSHKPGGRRFPNWKNGTRAGERSSRAGSLSSPETTFGSISG
jgi:hypothetical protein